MSTSAQSNGEVPGWVILSPDALPDAWRSRGIPMVLVPMTPSEAGQLLSKAPVDQIVRAADLPLVRLVAEGHNTTHIARALRISQRTVYRRLSRLRDEFSVSTLNELSTELARRGF